MHTCQAIESLDQVTIAAVNGRTIGGAVVFLSCLDLRLAAETTWFSIPEIDLRIPLTWNALPRLIRELGGARTKELVMTCDRFSSCEAESWGLVNRVIADDQLHSTARDLAAKLLSGSSIAGSDKIHRAGTRCNVVANRIDAQRCGLPGSGDALIGEE